MINGNEFRLVYKKENPVRLTLELIPEVKTNSDQRETASQNQPTNQSASEGAKQ